MSPPLRSSLTNLRTSAALPFWLAFHPFESRAARAAERSDGRRSPLEDSAAPSLRGLGIIGAGSWEKRFRLSFEFVHFQPSPHEPNRRGGPAAGEEGTAAIFSYLPGCGIGTCPPAPSRRAAR